MKYIKLIFLMLFSCTISIMFNKVIINSYNITISLFVGVACFFIFMFIKSHIIKKFLIFVLPCILLICIAIYLAVPEILHHAEWFFYNNQETILTVSISVVASEIVLFLNLKCISTLANSIVLIISVVLHMIFLGVSGGIYTPVAVATIILLVLKSLSTVEKNYINSNCKINFKRILINNIIIIIITSLICIVLLPGKTMQENITTYINENINKSNIAQHVDKNLQNNSHDLTAEVVLGGDFIGNDQPVFSVNNLNNNYIIETIYDTYSGSNWKSTWSDYTTNVKFEENNMKENVTVITMLQEYKRLLYPENAISITSSKKLLCDLAGNFFFDTSVPKNFSYKTSQSQQEKISFGIQTSDKYLSIYKDFSVRTLMLANDITLGINDDLQKINKIVEYLKTNYKYTTTPGDEKISSDYCEYFLFVSKKGYCMHFATSMTLLCRSLNIPARLATGFYVSNSSNDNPVIVTGMSRHAWVQVYVNGEWQSFDPTPGFVDQNANVVLPNDISSITESDSSETSQIADIDTVQSQLLNQVTSDENETLLNEEDNNNPKFDFSKIKKYVNQIYIFFVIIVIILIIFKKFIKNQICFALKNGNNKVEAILFRISDYLNNEYGAKENWQTYEMYFKSLTKSNNIVDENIITLAEMHSKKIYSNEEINVKNYVRFSQKAYKKFLSNVRRDRGFIKYLYLRFVKNQI